MTTATASGDGTGHRTLVNPTPQAVEDATGYLAGHWPASGRHLAYRPLVGALLRIVNPDAVRRIVERLVELTGDEEPDKRLGLVDDTLAKLDDPKNHVTGWPTLTERLGQTGNSIVRQFRLRLGLIISVEQLAAHKRLPVDFLQGLGLSDLELGGVGIAYHDASGKVVEVKQRVRLSGNTGSVWPKQRPLLIYGEEGLQDAVAKGYLILVEGESDTWTLRFHGEPVLGIPGADAVARTLHLGHVSPFSTIYAVQETDEGGQQFVRNIAQRLGELGWHGTLRVVMLGDSKDPSELHCRDPQVFPERWQAALAVASPLEVTPLEAALLILPVDPPWPDDLAEEAYHGLAGEIVRTIGPATEADPAALLFQVLVGVGNLIGRSAHFVAEADQHFLNEFVVLVGKTAKGRKGTSWGHVQRLLVAAEEEWARDRIQTGLSSGQGLIWACRDQIMKREKIKEKGEQARYEEVEADPGVTDKRLLVYEPEFANVLRQIDRDGNILSAVLRQAWESGNLRTLTKNDPARATGAHISLVGHITADELRRYLSTTEMANGYGNRHLWVCVKRSKVLPEGGILGTGALTRLQERLAEVIAFARTAGAPAGDGEARKVGNLRVTEGAPALLQMHRDDEAREVWHSVYAELSEGRPGLTGALLARGEAHVMRLACLYALFDQSPVIRAEHLLAALALWQYVEQSVYHVFGDSLGDSVADDILRLLRGSPQGATRNDLLNYFGRNQSSGRIGRALALLAEHSLARSEEQQTGGRPAERWFAVPRRDART